MVDPKKIVCNLIKLRSESEVVEFKEATIGFDFRKLGKYFSALSNEANLRGKKYAWLCFGVKDSDYSFVNTQFRKNGNGLQRLKGEISRATNESITFKEIYDFEIKPRKRVVLFQILPAPRGIPVSFKGHYYAREHDELVPLNIEKLERIRSQIPSPDWSKAICEDATIDDLDPAAIAKARELYATKNPRLETEIQKWSAEEFLDRAKITIRNKITNTAILLLGRSESAHFISPAVCKISWILRSESGKEVDYQHFTCPLILSIDKVYAKIRNLRYRYLQEGTLFPEEIDSYNPYVIREALNNCIAHQDYGLGGKINVVENMDGSLVFTNLGSFIPQTIENAISADAPALFYRNTFLAEAMVNLNMIDTIGSGIKNMFVLQGKKFFPLPDYDFSNNQVKVTIIGKVLDLNYARKLAQIPNLDLNTIILLDKVQKKRSISAEEARSLRVRGLVEGHRPNLYISSKVAASTRQESDYMKLRGADNAFCREQIIIYLRKYKSGTKKDFSDMLIDKLSSRLTSKQKDNKIKNILQALRVEGEIRMSANRDWMLTSKARKSLEKT